MLESTVLRFVVLIACASLFVLCDALAANWGKNGSTISLVTVVILSPFSYTLFGWLNQKYPLSIISAWVVLIICVASVIIGITCFNDQLSTRQWIGLALAIPAIALLVS